MRKSCLVAEWAYIASAGLGLVVGAGASAAWLRARFHDGERRIDELEAERDAALRRMRELTTSCERMLAETADRVESAARDANVAARGQREARGGLEGMLKELERAMESLAAGRRNPSAWLEQVETSVRRAETDAAQAQRGLETLVDETEALVRAVDATAGVGGAVADAIAQAEKHLAGLVQSSGETSTASHAMDDALARVHGGAAETATLSQKVVGESEKGYRAVHRTLDEIERIRQVTEQAAERIAALGTRVEGIGDVVRMIQEIAEKTNLLALNASIIAAQAGEHGRSFAVVAQEIKALAQRTSLSTKQIGEQIRGVQDDTQRAMEAMATGVKAVGEGFQVAIGAGDALGEIRQSARSAQKRVQMMARALDEQKDASRHVVDTAHQLAERASIVAAQVRGEAEHGVQLREGAKVVGEASQKLVRLAREQLEVVRGVAQTVAKAMGDSLVLTRGHKDLRRQIDLLHRGAARIQGLETDLADRLAQVDEAAARLREQIRPRA
jgi:methyl-accepting chemotaxis protein